MSHKLKFFEDDNGELSYEVIEETINEEELGDVTGGVKLPFGRIPKVSKYPPKTFREAPIMGYALPGMFARPSFDKLIDKKDVDEK